MIVTGDLPSLNDVPEVTAVPGPQAQEYVATIINDLFPPELREKTFLIDDSSGTSDDLVNGSGELISRGTAFDETPFSRVLLSCLDNDCEIRIWWASNDQSAHRNVLAFANKQAFQEHILSLLTTGDDVNVVYEPGNENPRGDG